MRAELFLANENSPNPIFSSFAQIFFPGFLVSTALALFTVEGFLATVLPTGNSDCNFTLYDFLRTFSTFYVVSDG